MNPAGVLKRERAPRLKGIGRAPKVWPVIRVGARGVGRVLPNFRVRSQICMAFRLSPGFSGGSSRKNFMTGSLIERRPPVVASPPVVNIKYSLLE
jgi:hypothetical protein